MSAMFKWSSRWFTTNIPRFEANSIRIHPTLAAKQFVPENATRSKRRSLRRRESRLKKQIIRDVNNLKKHESKRASFQVDPVLGDVSSFFIKSFRAQMEDPTKLAQGYEREEVEKLLYGAEKASLDSLSGNPALMDSVTAIEERKRRALMTILNIKNTNLSDKKAIAIKFAKEEFQRCDGDTGSPEVQAAVMTIKIHLGMDHIKKMPKDKAFIQYVRELVQQRQRILKYLKGNDPQKYFYTITKLGLTDDVITTEFSMDRQYFQDYKVWGDKQLIKLSDKQKGKQQKFVELQKRVQDYYAEAKKNNETINQNEGFNKKEGLKSVINVNRNES